MQYAVRSKLSQPQGRARCDLCAPAPVGSGGEFRGPVTGSIVLANTGALICARGNLHAVAVCECSRCLDVHEVGLDMEVGEECRLAQIDQPTIPDEEEPEPVPLLDGDAVDLTELVRQVLVLNYPPRSLCRPDCAGLCVHCGRNLNRGPCSCRRDSGDPRWGALRALGRADADPDGT